MHFSTTCLFSALFSFSFALPAKGPAAIAGLTPPADIPPEARSGRLDVSYDFSNPRQLSNDGDDKFSKEPLYDIKASVPFTIKAYNSESPIHLMDITAAGNKFFVGKDLAPLCPPNTRVCPNVTALKVTDQGGARLDVGVRGGQEIYVGPRAQLRFNDPGVPTGEDSSNATFVLTENPIPAAPGVSAFVFSGVGKATGYLACPIKPEGPWQVFVGLADVDDWWVPGRNVSRCIGFDALATNYTGTAPAAYTYS
ncbi:MAG: hypothetical protein Q9216_004199 [Gyalolechia sp. 2 TL-2023]